MWIRLLTYDLQQLSDLRLQRSKIVISSFNNNPFSEAQNQSSKSVCSHLSPSTKNIAIFAINQPSLLPLYSPSDAISRGGHPCCDWCDHVIHALFSQWRRRQKSKTRNTAGHRHLNIEADDDDDGRRSGAPMDSSFRPSFISFIINNISIFIVLRAESHG
jgi:hypothetical protein